MVSTGGKGDKFNVEVNVVPFIDLLSCLISFLLITAVWVQIAAIPASVDVKGHNAPTPTAPEKRLEIRLTKDAFQFHWPNAAMQGTAYAEGMAKVNGEYDLPKLEAMLKQLATTKLISTASVSADDEVEYGAVTRTIDIVKSGGIPAVAVNLN